MYPIFIVFLYLFYRDPVALLNFSKRKLNNDLEMLLLNVMWLLDMRLWGTRLLHFRKETMLRLFRNYLDPMLGNKGRLYRLHLGR